MVEPNEQTKQRLANLEALVEAGFEPFPYRYPKTHDAAQILAAHPGAEPGQEWPEEKVWVAGRLMTFRHMGKASFAHLQDASGRIQLYLARDTTEHYDLIKRLDVGDIVGAEGTVFTTRTGEVTVKVQRFTPLVKALHPLPDKWHGIKDVETRYRQRYLDLIQNPEVREVFRTRSRIVRYIRDYFDARGFLEVEGPTLQAVAGGTEAKPFTTYHEALGHEFYLRIALELHLKRLLVGGFEKVFEIGRNYRNEGISIKHNPEFTMLEAYWAYADYTDMMALIEDLLAGMVQTLHGRTTIPYGEHTLSFAKPFKRLDFTAALKERAGLDFDPTDLERLRIWSDARHPELRSVPSYKLLDKLFGEYVEPTLIHPTFVTDVPLAISPLVKRHRDPSRPALTERADLFVGGVELSPIYSELNDALEQRARFEEQARRRASGDAEEPEVDEDFLLALEYGMPPAAGMGLGIDRLTMFLTNQHSIRDVILFPLLKPRREEAEAADASE
ncbi:lysine--tRNA ligase [Meiothermus granaticius]|uniref:Lysine--tRNA ligase n=1 Tax=Meiothermus granaticius NBRC 107808 TaxID=1227551 RepID=A0A399F718_9DEIN|nr:lysine--tRNA ligase [Meiothermus granaticius]RIH91910.1 Lysine--tRNA ligase [Meiothermus granaticius NBRC 107808]GEM85470.1 lysine--tRNA ligase [Meiothermus granaticius NBRC 107808]